MTIYQDIPHSITPDIIQHGVMIHSSGAGIGGSVNNRDWFLPIITVVAFDGTFDQEAMIVDHDMEDQKLFSNHWLSGSEYSNHCKPHSCDIGGRTIVANVSGFSPDGIFSGWVDNHDIPLGSSWSLNPDNQDMIWGFPSLGRNVATGPFDSSYSSHLHYYGPIAKHLEDTDTGGTYPYVSNQYLGNTDPLHYSTTVSDVSISSAKVERTIFEDQQTPQDVGARSSSNNNPTFNWVEPQLMVAQEPLIYELECKDDSDEMLLWIIEDNGDGVFTLGSLGANGVAGDLYDPAKIGNYYNLPMIDNGYPNHRPFKEYKCGIQVNYTPKATGIGWLAVQCGVNANHRTVAVADGFCDFNIKKIEKIHGQISVTGWNMLNPTTTTVPWDSDMSGIGNGVIQHVLEVELSHQDMSSVIRADSILAEIKVTMSNNQVLSFPYTFHIEYVESVAGDVDPDDVLLPPDDDTLVEAEEDSGILGLPGFEMATMLLAMLSAAFVGRRKKYG